MQWVNILSWQIQFYRFEFATIHSICSENFIVYLKRITKVKGWGQGHFLAEVDGTNKGYLAEIVDQRYSASFYLNFRPKIVSKKRLDCFSVNFVKFQHSFFKEHLETAGNILKSWAFYRSLLNKNVRQFLFIFFKESFLSWVFKVFSSRLIALARDH